MEDHEAQSAKNLSGEVTYLAARNEVMAHSMCFECELRLKHRHYSTRLLKRVL